MNICIFCTVVDPPQAYREPSVQLATLLAEHGHSLVYGGSHAGLMRTVAETVKGAGGKVIGIHMDSLEIGPYPDADEMMSAKNLDERKAAMLSRSDAFVILVGGSGTLDELTHMIETKRHGEHNKPIVVLNTADFYDGLRGHLQRIEADGLAPPHSLDRLVQFVDTPAEAIDAVEKYDRLN